MPDLCRSKHAAQPLEREAVTEQQVVSRRRGEGVIGVPGSMGSGPVALMCDHLRLVERDPHAAVAECFGHDPCEVGEPLRRIAVAPATGVLERLWKVPVKQRHGRRDVAGTKPLDEPAVEVEPRLVDGPAAVGLDARPRDREPEGSQAKRLEQVEIGLAPVVEVARDVPRVAASHLPGCVAERIPDGRSAPILARGPFDLVSGGRCSPEEARRKPVRDPGRAIRVGHRHDVPFSAAAEMSADGRPAPHVGSGTDPLGEESYEVGVRCSTTISFCGEPGCPISYGSVAEGQPLKFDVLYSSNAAP